MPVNTNNINEIRVGVLGYSVDDSASGPGDGQWTNTGPMGDRTTLNALNSGERIITRILNSLDAAAAGTQSLVQAFDARFNRVVGNEGAGDQAAFDAIGSNIIQAISALTGAYSEDFTIGTVWVVDHNLNEQYVLVQVINNSGNMVIPDIEYTDADTCTLRFAKPTAGTVRIRR